MHWKDKAPRGGLVWLSIFLNKIQDSLESEATAFLDSKFLIWFCPFSFILCDLFQAGDSSCFSTSDLLAIHSIKSLILKPPKLFESLKQPPSWMFLPSCLNNTTLGYLMFKIYVLKYKNRTGKIQHTHIFVVVFEPRLGKNKWKRSCLCPSSTAIKLSRGVS